jgi:hypothetical protein
LGVLPVVMVVALASIGVAVWVDRRIVRARKGGGIDELAMIAVRGPGGTPERALEVRTAALVDTNARALGCLRDCGGDLDVVHHRAERTPELLRVVDLKCRRCGTPRRAYVRVLRPN